MRFQSKLIVNVVFKFQITVFRPKAVRNLPVSAERSLPRAQPPLNSARIVAKLESMSSAGWEQSDFAHTPDHAVKNLVRNSCHYDKY